MRVSLKLFLFVFFTAGSVSAETIRVATYNVYNYLIMDRQVEGIYFKDYPKPEDEKTALREVIREADADVLALQELGPRPFLRELQRDLKAEGLHYPYMAMVEGPDSDRRIAVLSRIPIVNTREHRNIRTRYQRRDNEVRRGLLEVEFETQGHRWQLFVVHLKSWYTIDDADPDARQQRIAEAHAIRNLIAERHPPESDPLFLVTGDFNDTRGSSTIRRFLQRGDTELGYLLPAEDSRGETWTSVYRREDSYRRVDMIILSPALRELTDPAMAAIVDLLPASRIASDHRLVYVDLEFPE